MTYLYVEMYWVFKGIYPNTLRELVEKSPGFPLDPLSPKMIVDPYSAYKLPLRYRVTVDRGPEIVSIGPDGHWGGWQDEGPTLFGTDDIKVDHTSASALPLRYLHASYCLLLLEGKDLTLSSIGVDGGGADRDMIIRYMVDRKPSAPLKATGPEALLQEMKAKFDIIPMKRGEYRGDDPLDAVMVAHTGFDSWLPNGPDSQQIGNSFWDAFSILQECTSSFLIMSFWGKESAVLETEPSWTGEARAYSVSLGHLPQEKLDKLNKDVRLVIFMQDHTIPAFAIEVVFPRDWFDEHSTARLKEAMARLMPDKQEVVREAPDGIAIVCPRSCEHYFYFADTLTEFLVRNENADE